MGEWVQQFNVAMVVKHSFSIEELSRMTEGDCLPVLMGNLSKNANSKWCFIIFIRTIEIFGQEFVLKGNKIFDLF